MNIVGDTAFHWILSVLTGGFAGLWLIHDALFLWRIRGGDRADPIVRDKQFGYVMGMVIGVIGLIGVLRFHGVL